jgi:hypothetical protein
MGCVLLSFVSQTVSPAPASAIPDRFALIIEGICQAVARRGGRLDGIAAPLIVLIWTRLRRLATRFARDAETPPAPSRPAAKRPARPLRSRPHPLPRRKAWLLLLVPETASGASQLRHFLADPEVSRLLAAAPHLRRTLRPLCLALGIRLALALPPPLPPPSQPTDAPPSAPPIPTHASPQAASIADPPAAVPPAALPPWKMPPPPALA